MGKNPGFGGITTHEMCVRRTRHADHTNEYILPHAHASLLVFGGAHLIRHTMCARVYLKGLRNITE